MRGAADPGAYGKIGLASDSVCSANGKTTPGNLRTCVDLFCGIGGFHLAASDLGIECVFACDIDEEARRAYEHNFKMTPFGDIISIEVKDIPDHDLLCGGFPCQPFSIIGNRRGFDDPRGGMFKHILRVLRAKRPEALLLENVRQLATMGRGEALKSIMKGISGLGYHVDARVLNALDFGLPQKRERLFIVGTRKDIDQFKWPNEKVPVGPLDKILEKNPDSRYFASGRIKRARRARHKPKVTPSIWHENKGGNISSYPYSCALRASASYNYLLVNGERRLTPREMLRLQGFPDAFKIVSNDSQIRKQAGNAVPVPVVKAVLARLLDAYR